jgi:hypothetical protein
MFKEVMNDLWLARISSLSNEVGLYVVLLEVLLFMPNSLIRHSKSYKHDIVGSLVLRNDNIFVKPTSFDKDEILANHRSFMTSLNIPSGITLSILDT